MLDIPRYLITTCDERTWKHDCPVLFLGEWCRLYDRKHVWEKLDSIVATPYGLGKQQKDKDYVLSKNLEEKTFPILCHILNEHHNIQHTDRFWRIMLGHWLSRFISVIINRVNTIKLCLESYKINGTSCFSSSDFTLTPLDSNFAIWAFNNERYNHELFNRIINLLAITSFPINIISEPKVDYLTDNFENVIDISYRKRIIDFTYNKITKITRKFTRDEDAFIINSYLPTYEVIKLELSIGQIPQLWKSTKYYTEKQPDISLRSFLTSQMPDKNKKTLSGIISSLIFELLPICYLEGFEELKNIAQLTPWPKNPKFIFTSNNYDTDEIFKYWAATKVGNGSKYIIGQHGNNYGTYRYMWPSNEEITADKFITWGWTDNLPQHKPAFIFKTAGKNKKKYSPKGGLLLIEVHVPHYIKTWDVTAEFQNYFADQIKFVNTLSSAPKKLLTIRLHSGSTNHKWNEFARWRELDPTLKIDTGKVPIEKLIDKSRLVVHSYDSTGLLETLSQNIPSLAFWQNDFDHLRENCINHYQLLVDCGIVHLSPSSIAAKINEIWDDVEGWWSQIHLQNARKQFCENYARGSKNPISDLKNIIDS